MEKVNRFPINDVKRRATNAKPSCLSSKAAGLFPRNYLRCWEFFDKILNDGIGMFQEIPPIVGDKIGMRGDAVLF